MMIDTRLKVKNFVVYSVLREINIPEFEKPHKGIKCVQGCPVICMGKEVWVKNSEDEKYYLVLIDSEFIKINAKFFSKM